MKVKELVEKLLELEQEVEIYVDDIENGNLVIAEVQPYYKGRVVRKSDGQTWEQLIPAEKDRSYFVETILDPMPIRYVIEGRRVWG